MTLDQARMKIGSLVIYQPGHLAPEWGAIVEVRDPWVFVRYGIDRHAKATRPEDLKFAGLTS